jgi:hypothetical protein
VDPKGAAAVFVGRLTPHELETVTTFSRRYAATGLARDPCEPDGNPFVDWLPAR